MKEETILYATPDPDTEENSVIFGGCVDSTEVTVAAKFDAGKLNLKEQRPLNLMLEAKNLINNHYPPPDI